MKIMPHKAIVIFIGVLFYGFSILSSHACSVDPEYVIPSLGERYTVAKYVVIAENKNYDYKKGSKIHVSEWLKGDGPKEITIKGGRFCNPEITGEDRSIIFLKDKTTDNEFELLYYGYWSGSAESTPEAINELELVQAIGLRELLHRKGTAIEVQGILKSEETGEWQAMIKPVKDGQIIKVRNGDIIHLSNAKVIYIDEYSMKVEMMTGETTMPGDALIVDLNIPE